MYIFPLTAGKMKYCRKAQKSLKITMTMFTFRHWLVFFRPFDSSDFLKGVTVQQPPPFLQYQLHLITIKNM